MSEKIKLHNLEGYARISGEDEHGCNWIQYELEEGYYDEEEDTVSGDTCSVCGAEIWRGWVCGDGGDVVCSEHIELDKKELAALRK